MSLVARQEGMVTENVPEPCSVHAELQAFENAADFVGIEHAAEFAGQPVEIESDAARVR